MKKLALLLVSATVVCACSGSRSIVGVWKIDIGSAKGQALDEMKKDPKLAADIQKGFEKSRFMFSKDGSLVITGLSNGHELRGSWKMVNNSIDITFAEDRFGGEKPKFTVSEDGSKIHMSQGGSMAAEMDLVKAS